MASRIGDLRRRVALGHYELTSHAKDEMEQDGFTIQDVKSAVYAGRIVGTQRHGRGPRKLVVAGRADGSSSSPDLSLDCVGTSADYHRIYGLAHEIRRM